MILATRQLMLLTVLLLFCGCTLPQPGISERDNVLPFAGDQVIEVTTPMIFYDMTIRYAKFESGDAGEASPHRASVRILAGKYKIESSDKDYYYFRSPGGVELAILDVDIFPIKNPVPRELRNLPGGLILSRQNSLTTPAGIFIDGDAQNRKLIVWCLGGEFFSRRTIDWDCK